MLGFNKHVIPFQREGENIPFNVAGLDTIKYNQNNFKELATKAISHANQSTQLKEKTGPSVIEIIQKFLMHKGAFLNTLSDPGDKSVYDLGRPLDFYLANNISGLEYVFVGLFIGYGTNSIAWHLLKIDSILAGRAEAIKLRASMGQISEAALPIIQGIWEKTKIWLILKDQLARAELKAAIDSSKLYLHLEVFTLEEVEQEYSLIPR